MTQPMLQHMRRFGILALAVLLATAVASIVGYGQAASAARQAPGITLSGPAQVAVGKPLMLSVSGSGLGGLAAVEAHLLFDRAAASFDAAVYDDAPFSAIGR